MAGKRDGGNFARAHDRAFPVCRLSAHSNRRFALSIRMSKPNCKKCLTPGVPTSCGGLEHPQTRKIHGRNLSRLPTTLMIGVGAAFDFHAGRVGRPRDGCSRSGLEWFSAFAASRAGSGNVTSRIIRFSSCAFLPDYRSEKIPIE